MGESNSYSLFKAHFCHPKYKEMRDEQVAYSYKRTNSNTIHIYCYIERGNNIVSAQNTSNLCFIKAYETYSFARLTHSAPGGSTRSGFHTVMQILTTPALHASTRDHKMLFLTLYEKRGFLHKLAKWCK